MSEKEIDLRTQFPEATYEECERFRKAFASEASIHLSAYLEFRQSTHSVIMEERQQQQQTKEAACLDDKQLWQYCSEKACAYIDKQRKSKATKIRDKAPQKPCCDNNSKGNLPQLVFCFDTIPDVPVVRDRDGHCIFYVPAARIDLSRGCQETYTLALACFLECIFHRHSMEQYLVVVDVRPGRGWANPPAPALVGFIRHVTRELYSLFPRRLYHCVVFPLPRPAMWIWRLCQPFLPGNVREAVSILPGAAGLDSPPPKNRLQQFLEMSTIEALECTRQECIS